MKPLINLVLTLTLSTGWQQQNAVSGFRVPPSAHQIFSFPDSDQVAIVWPKSISGSGSAQEVKVYDKGGRQLNSFVLPDGMTVVDAWKRDLVIGVRSGQLFATNDGKHIRKVEGSQLDRAFFRDYTYALPEGEVNTWKVFRDGRILFRVPEEGSPGHVVLKGDSGEVIAITERNGDAFLVQYSLDAAKSATKLHVKWNTGAPLKFRFRDYSISLAAKNKALVFAELDPGRSRERDDVPRLTFAATARPRSWEHYGLVQVDLATAKVNLVAIVREEAYDEKFALSRHRIASKLGSPFVYLLWSDRVFVLKTHNVKVD
jgi:hypothetical protein